VRVIAKKHLGDYWTRHPDAESSLRAWYDEAVNANWKSPQDIRDQHVNASFIANNRVVFNIKGNSHRLIVAVAYKFNAVYIKFIGTHRAYDKVDAATIEMD
jgi:mRNA interferase HigB